MCVFIHGPVCNIDEEYYNPTVPPGLGTPRSRYPPVSVPPGIERFKNDQFSSASINDTATAGMCCLYGYYYYRHTGTVWMGAVRTGTVCMGTVRTGTVWMGTIRTGAVCKHEEG